MSCNGELAFPEWTTDLDWWQKTVVYQIYPRSFQDSTGDGIGDLKGIVQRLDHFRFLGVETLWLSPFYKSPMKDFGYDVSDFKDVDPVFGTLDDFKSLVKAVYDRGMRLVLDYVPNHSSDLHPWFKESCKGGADNPYTDYYVWHDGKQLPDGSRVPPNNWRSVFGGSAWTWLDSRKQFYFHQYLAEQPDLNWRNPKVKQEMQDVFRFWLDLGADGFRIDAIAMMYETEDVFQDELADPDRHPDTQPDEYRYYDHVYTRHQPETFHIIAEWRRFFNQYQAETGKPHIYLVTAAYDWPLKHVMGYYEQGADCPFNFNLGAINTETDARGVHKLVDSWLQKMPQGKWPNWVMGNHDRNRVTSRKGAEFADTLNTLLLLLPGTPTTYQGEELAMLDIRVPYHLTQDPHGKNFGPDRYEKFSRDPCRSPMQWSSEKNAGFSSADHTWLPVHPNYTTCNVQMQKSAASGQSSLLLYRDLVKLRQHPSFLYGAMYYGLIDENIFSFVRFATKDTPYLVAMNVGKETFTADLSVQVNSSRFTRGKVRLQSASLSMPLEKELTLTSVTLQPGQVLVYQLI